MATILEFRGSRDDAPKARDRKSPQSAEIVIFPGVRYERWSADTTPIERVKASMHRDPMKLAE